jgi:hypothetical protein
MTLQQLYFLEYVCAGFTALCCCFFFYYYPRFNHHKAAKGAGARLCVVRRSRGDLLRKACHFIPPIMLAFCYLLLSLWQDLFFSPRLMFLLFFLMFHPIIFFFPMWIMLRICEGGVEAYLSGDPPFLPWPILRSCRWIRTKQQLEFDTTLSQYTFPVNDEDAEKALPILGRFVQTKNECGEILFPGSERRPLAEAEAADFKQNFIRSRYQFSILSLLLLTVVVAAGSGWYAVDKEYMRIQQKALNDLQEIAPFTHWDSSYTVETLNFSEPLLNVPPAPNAPPARSKFSDKDVELLRPFHRLRHLFLSKTSITDASIPDLVEFKLLKTFSIRNTKITPEGAQRMRKEMPHTEIFY